MFRTELPLTPHPSQLPLAARVLTIGSCFSDTIGRRLAQHKVSTLVNPFGTVFNPLSACLLLRAAAGEEQDWQQHLVEARGRWQSYDLPAEVGADSPVTLLQQIRELVQQTGEFLATTDVVVLTLGTAFAYRLLETDELVSNCHKIPADKFEKELLTPDEIINAVAETHAYLRLKNPKLRIILTVSPVRHLKDTLPLNAVSKSVLRVACHYLSELLPDVSYFPAYELLLDDLRDYRFYAADMLHPSDVAENYIWERFTRTYFDQSFGRFKKEWEAVRQALGHRPLYAAAPEHRTFLEGTLARLQALAGQADVSAEIRGLEQELAALPVPVQLAPEPEFDDDEERIDIGDEAAAPVSAEAAPAPEAAEAPRRDQGRDRGRNGRNGRPDRTPRPEALPVVGAEPALTAPEASVLPVPDAAPAAVEAAAEAVGSAEVPALPKKKRRSRGGAKRTARKNAAKAALEAAQQAGGSVTQSLTIEPAAPAVAARPVEAAPVAEVPLLKPELEVLHELPPVDLAPTLPSAAAPASTPAPVSAPVPPAPRPPVTYQKLAPKGDWLVPMKDGDVPLPKRPAKGIVRTPPTRKNTKSTIVTPPKSAAKAAAKPEPAGEATAIPVTSAPAPAVVAAAQVEPVVTPAPVAVPSAPAAPKAAAKKKAAPKKAAAPVAPAATAAGAEAPAAKSPAKAKPTKTAAKPATTAKAAPKTPVKAQAAPAPEPVSPEATPLNQPKAPKPAAAPRKPTARKAAPKAAEAPAETAAAPKRARPPRKKPTQPGEGV